MTDQQPKDAETWRAKYYDQLEELERKENEWQRIEQLLREGLLQLSLLADPADEALDRDLQQFRSALRRGTASASLKPLLEGIGGGAKRLEQQRKESGAPSADASVRQLLSQLIQQLLQPRAPQEAKLLLGRVVTADAGALAHLGDELATALYDAGAPSAALPLHTILLQLVEYLAIPAELNEEVEAVKSLLAHPLADDQIEGALRRIAGLVGEVRRRVLNEKRELENFLRVLTESLQELDQNVHATIADQLESFSDGRKLGQAMDAHMEDLEASMQSASELEVLKAAIQQRVTTIRGHMDAFRQAEERRSTRAEQSVALLTARLEEVEREAISLRERIRLERSQALIDPLTGIFNRLAYDERLVQEYQRWKRYHGPLALAVWDVDRFKRVNDRYGHQAGDKVLKVVAKLLGAQVRSTDFLCRYGGEEFVVLLPETTLKNAQTAMEKLRASVEAAEFHYRGEQVKITVSCGLAEFAGEDTPDDVFARADQALYRAKERGRNCCVGG